VWRNLFLIEWEILGAEPLSPERATAAAPGSPGRYVEIEGELVPTDRYLRLDGALDVEAPSMTFSDRRHTIPSAEAVARYREILGSGRRVTVRGELGHDYIHAFSITDESGPLDI
jgi:hypothetical protein